MQIYGVFLKLYAFFLSFFYSHMLFFCNRETKAPVRRCFYDVVMIKKKVFRLAEVAVDDVFDEFTYSSFASLV